MRRLFICFAAPHQTFIPLPMCSGKFVGGHRRLSTSRQSRVDDLLRIADVTPNSERLPNRKWHTYSRFFGFEIRFEVPGLDVQVQVYMDSPPQRALI